MNPILITIGDQAHPNGYESAPIHVLRELDRGDQTLLIGVAGWGVNWGEESPPPDPAGLDWKGSRPRRGKRFKDGPGPKLGTGYGGLGICHADSSFLRQVYLDWGSPNIPQSVLDSRSYDQIRKSKHWHAWQEWGATLVQSHIFHTYLVNEWKRKYWGPALEVYGETVEASLNARISNSSSSLGRALRREKAGIAEQVTRYVERGKKKSPRSGRRMEARVNLVLRLSEIWKS